MDVICTGDGDIPLFLSPHPGAAQASIYGLVKTGGAIKISGRKSLLKSAIARSLADS